MKTKPMMTGLLALVALASATAAHAGSKITIEKDHSTRVSLTSAAGSVIVGNPAIADVTIVDSRTLYIIGRGFGRSSVTVTDGLGRTIFDGDVVVGTPIDGGVTVFKGLKSSTMICARTCTEQNEGMYSGNASPAAPGS